MQLRLVDGNVILKVNQFDILSYNFDENFNDNVGIGVHKATSIFSDIQFIGDEKKGIIGTLISLFG